MSKSCTNFCILFLAVIALGWAQVAGLSQHYVCVCSGDAIETMVDHCHDSGTGLVNEDTHDHESDPQGGTKPHLPLRTEFKANGKVLAPVTVQMPLPVMIFDLPDFAKPLLEHELQAIAPLTEAAPGDLQESPPLALQVMECQVLLV